MEAERAFGQLTVIGFSELQPESNTSSAWEDNVSLNCIPIGKKFKLKTMSVGKEKEVQLLY